MIDFCSHKMGVVALFGSLCLLLLPLESVCEKRANISVHVLCDNEMTYAFASSHLLHQYVYAFFNAVNLILTKNENVKIELVIAKIEDARTSHSFSGKIILGGKHGSSVDVAATTKELQTLFSQHAEYNKSHILFLLTKRGMLITFENPPSGTKQPRQPLKLPEYPKKGALCTKESIVIGQDDAKFFMGVLPAARQIARLMGAPYDVDPDKMNECSHNRYNLMGNASLVGSNSYKLSSCTRRALSQAIDGIQSKCPGRSVQQAVGANRTILPADVLPPDEFCKSLYAHEPNPGVCSSKYRGANSYLGRECMVKCCYASDLWKPVIWLDAALDGYPCGTAGQICIHRKCGTRP